MSKFQSTISTVAALTTIFGAAVGGWKIAEQQKEYNHQQDVINQLQQKISDKPREQVSPPVVVQQPQVQTQPVVIPAPQQVILPAPPPVPAIQESQSVNQPPEQ